MVVHTKKADSDTNFDVTMGAYDGAETSELVGLYILHVLIEEKGLLEKNSTGIYRDDGLAVVKGTKRSALQMSSARM